MFIKITIVALLFSIALGKPAYKKDDSEISDMDTIEKVNSKLIEHTNGEISPRALYQTDIILNKKQIDRLKGKKQGNKRDAIDDGSVVWPSAVIPYELTPDFSEYKKEVIHDGMKHISKKTCIRFRKRTTKDDYFIKFVDTGGCTSSLGFQSSDQYSGQEISIAGGCEFQATVVHEILHALGFVHEQARSDREKYVNIHTENIRDGYEYAFNREQYTRNFNYEYDYKSVMHYSSTAFSENGKKTITAIKDPNMFLGQKRNGGLSRIDALQVNAMYCNGPWKGDTTPKTKITKTITIPTRKATTKPTRKPTERSTTQEQETVILPDGVIDLSGNATDTGVSWTGPNDAYIEEEIYNLML